MFKYQAFSIFFVFYSLCCATAANNEPERFSLFGLESTYAVDAEIVTLISKCIAKLNYVLEEIDSFIWMQMCLVECIFIEGGYYSKADNALNMAKIEARFQWAYPNEPEIVEQRMKEVEYCITKSKDYVTTVTSHTESNEVSQCDGTLFGVMSCAVVEHIRLENTNGDLVRSLLKLNQKLQNKSNL